MFSHFSPLLIDSDGKLFIFVKKSLLTSSCVASYRQKENVHSDDGRMDLHSYRMILKNWLAKPGESLNVLEWSVENLCVSTDLTLGYHTTGKGKKE